MNTQSLQSPDPGCRVVTLGTENWKAGPEGHCKTHIYPMFRFILHLVESHQQTIQEQGTSSDPEIAPLPAVDPCNESSFK